MQALHELMELKDMSMIQEKFAALFSNYTDTTKARPDGGVLLTLCDSEGTQTLRSISYAQLHPAEQQTWVISASRRDLAGQASELPTISLLLTMVINAWSSMPRTCRRSFCA